MDQSSDSPIVIVAVIVGLVGAAAIGVGVGSNRAAEEGSQRIVMLPSHAVATLTAESGENVVCTASDCALEVGQSYSGIVSADGFEEKAVNFVVEKKRSEEDPYALLVCLDPSEGHDYTESDVEKLKIAGNSCYGGLSAAQRLYLPDDIVGVPSGFDTENIERDSEEHTEGDTITEDELNDF